MLIVIFNWKGSAREGRRVTAHNVMVAVLKRGGQICSGTLELRVINKKSSL
ncbi:hypothetical protein SBF1_1840002 [Candidatus Desulfosporosinus infrequens]|uniref:Uncharacterized protein n=1 Tax=Candidatus Desulfosporosinus infrequens TaxID=2043169 RepID=A0A2U3KDH4_9FIRM|nr:hypothetical protein SBF1_1840002 [Candidatus Desulfosporosinus infrequens]